MPIDPFIWRLRNQQLLRSASRSAADVVSRLGAMQAQDYAGAKWAIGLRSSGLDDAAIEREFNAGGILRTHMMRPTWHFVAPADIRWIQRLTGPRVEAMSALYYRRGGLDAATLRKGVKVLERSLRDRTYRTREALAGALAKAGVPLEGEALAYLVMHAEVNGVVCSGPREGRQFTYALVEERAAPAPAKTRDEALAELLRRYLTSHGPATLKDFSWWSGLTMRDGREGAALLGDTVAKETIDGLTYWFVPGGRAPSPPKSPAVMLLPNYDEFGIAYRDRVLMRALPRLAGMTERDEFAHLLVIDRELTGRWRRGASARSVNVEVRPFRKLTKAETRGVESAVETLGAFLRLPATMTTV